MAVDGLCRQADFALAWQFDMNGSVDSTGIRNNVVTQPGPQLELPSCPYKAKVVISFLYRYDHWYTPVNTGLLS